MQRHTAYWGIYRILLIAVIALFPVTIYLDLLPAIISISVALGIIIARLLFDSDIARGQSKIKNQEDTHAA